MTFTKFNEFSYAATGALYMLSSHAQLALCLSVLFFTTCYLELKLKFKNMIGGASAASEATLSSCPLRFAVYVGGFSTCNQSLRR